MSLTVLMCVIVSILIAIFAVIDAVSTILSVVAIFKLSASQFPVEAYFASMFNAVPLGISFFTLLFVTLPAGVSICVNKSRSLECCKYCTNVCTFYVSVIVATSIAIIGTVIAGILQIFSITNYKEVLSNSEASTFGGAAAALNFTAAAFGAVIIVATIVACVIDDEKEKNWCCSGLGMIALISITVLLIASLAAALFTIFSGLLVASYSEEGINSKSYELATFAIFCSGGSASCLLLGFCIGGGVVCFIGRDENKCSCKIHHVLTIWGFLSLGTIVAGGLMMKVGQRFSSGEQVLSMGHHMDVPLNRGSIAALAYLVGGLNFVALFIALFPFLLGIVLCVMAIMYKK